MANSVPITNFGLNDSFIIRKDGESTFNELRFETLINQLRRTNFYPNKMQESQGSGTAYSLTNTAAKITFGTTSPGLTLPTGDSYKISYMAVLKYNGATFAANQNVILKVRRTNNTAADLQNSDVTLVAGIITTNTAHFALVAWEFLYTPKSTGETLELWGSVATAPSAGSLDVTQARMIAERIVS